MNDHISQKVRPLLTGRIAKGAVGSLVMKTSAVSLNLVTAIFLGRILGASGFGAYGFALACVELLLIPAMLGLPQLLAREVPQASQRQDWQYLRDLVSRSFYTVLVSSVLFALTGYALSTFFLDSMDPGMTFPLQVGLVTLPLLALCGTGAGALRGLGLTLGQMPLLIVQPAFIVIVVGFIAWQAYPLSAVQAVAVNMLGAALALIMTLVLWRHYKPGTSQSTPSKLDWKTLSMTGLPFTLIAGFSVINNQADIIMLGLMSTAEQTGLYRVASRLAQPIGFPLMALVVPLGPILAEMYATNDVTGMRRRAVKSSVVAFIAALIIGGVFIVGNNLLLSLFGSEFGAADQALLILCLGQIVNALLGTAGIVLSMTGHETAVARSMALTGTLNVVLNALLIPAYGLEGAAVATVASSTVGGLILLRTATTRLGFNPTALALCSSIQLRRQ